MATNDREKADKKFKKLDQEWRDDMLGRGTPQLYKSVVEYVFNLIGLEMAKEVDEDLHQLKEALKTANEVYTEGKKVNTLRVEFIRQVLEDRGEAVPGLKDFIRAAKDEVVEN